MMQWSMNVELNAHEHVAHVYTVSPLFLHIFCRLWSAGINSQIHCTKLTCALLEVGAQSAKLMVRCMMHVCQLCAYFYPCSMYAQSIKLLQLVQNSRYTHCLKQYKKIIDYNSPQNNEQLAIIQVRRGAQRAFKVFDSAGANGPWLN